GNSSAGKISILLGNGDGTFGAAKVSSLTTDSVGMSAGDFNGDKKSDLIISSEAPATGNRAIQLLIGNGDRTLQAAKSIVADSGSRHVGVAVSDFNNDGKSDLAIATSTGVQALLGNGDGTFQPGGTAAVESAFNVNSFVVGDINGDGKEDLVV